MTMLFHLLFFCRMLFPHGDQHQLLLELTDRIAQYPDSTELYLERGELLLLHEDFKAAQSDFHFCIHHKLLNTRAYLGLSKSLWPDRQADSSLFYVNLALDLNVAHPTALEWKGFLLQQMGRYCESAETYVYLLSLAAQPSPSLFIDASQAQALCPETNAEQKSILILMDGMDRIGRLHVLEKELVGVYLHFNRLDEAIRIQTDIIDRWAFKTKPYYERAKLYSLSGDTDLAIKDLNTALYELDSLPDYKSSTPAMKTLKAEILSLLNQLEN